MINLFHIPEYDISTSIFDHQLHGSIVGEFEDAFCDYVGAKYGVALNSATNAIFLSMLDKGVEVELPTIIPPVVCNAIITSGNSIKFKDDVSWVGGQYILHDFGDYRIIDSAQQVERDQYRSFAKDSDLMVFSFYPTKPIGSCDGGMIVSNDREKIDHIRLMAYNGMSLEKSNWERQSLFAGYKFYMNSVQAHIALQNLNKLDDKNRRLSEIRSEYNYSFILSNTSNHLYQINVEDNTSSMKILADRGISSGVHYRCVHKQPAYSDIGEAGNYQQSLHHEKTSLSIPFNEKLTCEEISYVVESCMGMMI